MTDRPKQHTRAAPDASATGRPMTPEEIREREERERQRKMAGQKPDRAEPRHEDPVDESSDESFPASDPPAHGGGGRH